MVSQKTQGDLKWKDGARRGRKAVDHAGEVRGCLRIVAMLPNDAHGHQLVNVECNCRHPRCRGLFIARLDYVIAGKASCRARKSTHTCPDEWERILKACCLAEGRAWVPTRADDRIQTIRNRREAEIVRLASDATIGDLIFAETAIRPGHRTAVREYEEPDEEN